MDGRDGFFPKSNLLRRFLAAAWKSASFRQPAALAKSVGVLLLIALLGFLAFRFDHPVAALAPGAGGSLAHLAGEFSYWGDFLPGTLPLSLGLIVAGALWRRPGWQRAGLAALLAAVLAGGLVSSFRITLGRPRPYATATEVSGKLGHVPVPLLCFGQPAGPDELADGFYGLQKPMLFHSFPSGHASTSMATAAALAVALPPVGAVAVLGACGVCWSRFYLQRHYLSDLTVGGGIGIAVGLYFGFVARRLNREA